MKKIVFLFISIFFHQNTQAQFIDWRQKVEKEVLEQGASQPTDYLIIMTENADLSNAYTLKTKIEKGTFVFNTLKETAERTQENVISILDKNKISYRSYLINNTLWAKSDLKTIASIALLPEVKVIAYNPVVHFDEPTITPNADEGARGIEWSISHIGADQVWALAGQPKGQGIVIGGQDTGYQWDHPALKNQYRGWNGTTANHNYNWHDAISTLIGAGTNPCGTNAQAPCDDNNHGTHTMGTMVGDDGGSNQIGIAPSAKWIGCRNMDRGDGTPATYTDCFNFFLAPTNLTNSPSSADVSKAPDVINNSWGCPPSEGCTSVSTYTAMEMAVNSLTAAGIVVVVSAGNSGPNCSTVADPAAIFENSFTVGATNSLDQIANFSSRGPAIYNGINRRKPDISAPGVNIRSSITGNGYGAGWQGTSMAGPHVAGTVALMLSANSILKKNTVFPHAVTTILRNTAVQSMAITTVCPGGGVTGSSWPNNTFGDGRINALAAVNQAVLPILLKDFRGKISNNDNIISWKTEIEVNNDFFELEKSFNGISFFSIAKIKAKGKGIGEQSYFFTDENSTQNLSYYRLRQVNVDKSSEYSDIIVLKRENKKLISVGPNPSKGFLNVALDNEENDILEIQFSNINGQILKKMEIEILKGKNQFTLNLEDLPKGSYTFSIQNKSKTFFHNQLLVLTE
jgi:serine protease AprX